MKEGRGGGYRRVGKDGLGNGDIAEKGKRKVAQERKEKMA
jgi:hypothetical protein